MRRLGEAEKKREKTDDENALDSLRDQNGNFMKYPHEIGSSASKPRLRKNPSYLGGYHGQRTM
jgi:hypothetical protein